MQEGGRRGGHIAQPAGRSCRKGSNLNEDVIQYHQSVGMCVCVHCRRLSWQDTFPPQHLMDRRRMACWIVNRYHFAHIEYKCLIWAQLTTKTCSLTLLGEEMWGYSLISFSKCHPLNKHGHRRRWTRKALPGRRIDDNRGISGVRCQTLLRRWEGAWRTEMIQMLPSWGGGIIGKLMHWIMLHAATIPPSWRQRNVNSTQGRDVCSWW